MAGKSIDVVVAGYLCLDIHPGFTNEPSNEIASILRPGGRHRMGAMSFAAGGTVSHTGIALKRFGLTVAFAAKVSDDPIGRTTVELLGTQGDTAGISSTKGETASYTVVLSPAGIDRILLHCPGANDTFTADDIDYSPLQNARFFHLGSPTRMNALLKKQGTELEKIFTKAKECGVVTSMDISLPDPGSPGERANWHTIYERTLPHVDIFSPSIEEAFFTLDPGEYLVRKETHGGAKIIDHVSPSEYSSIAATYIAMGCAVVVLKAGHLGCYLRTAGPERIERMGLLKADRIEEWANREIWCPAFKVDRVAGTEGVGDSAVAGFLAALVKGYSPTACLKCANCAGSMSLAGSDPTSGLSTWEEMTSAIKTMETEAVPALGNTEWWWDDEERVWTR
ncbi:MAG: hypothetical protein GF344_00140 [Chitinivibrionales bacterium]|nr:hypothetical protein [Chitinivibrionales bacterium]MBD3355541.1 hypothetical protein [Chitinivibrionales bacterium]